MEFKSEPKNQKKVIKVKLGEPVPADSKLLKIEETVSYVRPPQGGDKRKVITEWFYYEVPV